MNVRHRSLTRLTSSNIKMIHEINEVTPSKVPYSDDYVHRLQASFHELQVHAEILADYKVSVDGENERLLAEIESMNAQLERLSEGSLAVENRNLRQQYGHFRREKVCLMTTVEELKQDVRESHDAHTELEWEMEEMQSTLGTAETALGTAEFELEQTVMELHLWQSGYYRFGRDGPHREPVMHAFI